ncbi:MAG TPA: UDP-N-acetylmuramoyl-L-alanine--D-glutamate ligase [Ilumatobacter sp.]|nr:UDP-N-acetylmuramoyl-L-alanine--D-glutamate ligase [Ilumatobacter sp.]
MPRALVYGLAVTGAATVAALARHGYEVVAVDDVVDEAKLAEAERLGVHLLIGGTFDPADVAGFDLLAPAPGIPETHPVVLAAFAAGVPVRTELELAYRWEQERARPRPILAITGTDGKTTTTELTVAILRAAGLHAADVGNTDTPMVAAIDWDGTHADEPELDAFVVECTSFRLAWTEQFRADAAVWLNLAPDHLNWHTDLDSYVAAKARIFSLQRPDDVAIGFADDPVVMTHLAAAPARHRTFATQHADYRVEVRDGDTWLWGPNGPIAAASTMTRALPHDLTNALAASALVLETGLATEAHIAAALATFSAPPHRLEPVGEADGVRWYNDSKATTPHAAATAIRAFDSLVLIAGGSRKGVDLSPLGAYPERMRAVVAVGEAGPDVAGVFADRTPPVRVVTADDMAAAIATAGELAQPGDAVVLSPGCASFDWYANYVARGDDFRQKVQNYLHIDRREQQ